MEACPALITPGGAFLSGVLTYVDCQAQAIGLGGWAGLTGPGSATALILGGMLTIFVALFGYRLMLGDTPNLREGVVAVVKVGVVMLLATSWPAFRTLAYDVAMHGPAELASAIGGPASLPGAGGGLVARLQGVDDALLELTKLGTGKPPDADIVVGPTQALTPEMQQQQMQKIQLMQQQQRPRGDPVADAKLVSDARGLYLTTAIGGFAAVRVVAGLLLALGPLFVLFLLFDGTRGLFEGWVRGVAGAALGALATAIVLGVELAILEPWLAEILAQRRLGTPTPTVPIEIHVLTLSFALALLATLIAAAWVARGFRLPDTWRQAPARLIAAIAPASPRLAQAGGGETVASPDRRSRAAAVSDAVAAAQRREATPAPVNAIVGTRQTAGASVSQGPDGREVTVPLGQSFRRRTRGRISAGARRRDGRQDGGR